MSERATLKSATGQIKLSVPLRDLKRWRADGYQARQPLGGAIATVAQKLQGVAVKTGA